MHDGDEILEVYILVSSAYLLYDLYAMYEGFVLRLHETEEKVAESSTVVLFVKKHTFLVIHHVIAECYGLPVVTVCSTLQFHSHLLTSNYAFYG